MVRRSCVVLVRVERMEMVRYKKHLLNLLGWMTYRVTHFVACLTDKIHHDGPEFYCLSNPQQLGTCGCVCLETMSIEVQLDYGERMEYCVGDREYY